MSKKLLSVAMMLMTLFATTVWADYNYSFAYDSHLTGTLNRSDRKTTSVTLVGSASGTHSVNTEQSGYGSSVFYDYTATAIWEVKAGETLTPSMAYTGEWMHKFVYIDFGQDGKFDVNLIGSGPFTKGDNNDLVAWGHINGYDSNGVTRNESYNGNPPAFTLPDNLPAGDYRCRFKLDWNDPTPYGTTKDFVSGAGIMVDVILRVTVDETPQTGNYIVSYTLDGFDAELGDPFSVLVGDEQVQHSKEFTEAHNVLVTAEAGEGRMVTLTVNGRPVNSPYSVEENSSNISIMAKYEAFRSPTATKDVYPTLGLFGDDMMDLFARVDAEGRMFPTDEEFEAIGVNLADLAFVRSHVRPQEILDRATRFNQDAYERRNLWMNLPIGIGKEVGGYPSSNFSDDAFTAWNYTNLFGSWNHGLLHSPGVAADAAHRNGTDIMAGIKFFESWTAGSQAAGWVGKCQQESENGYQSPTTGKRYKYVRPVVNALLYFGKDGINYNFEDNGYANLADFHSCMYDYAAEIGFTNFHIGLYTAASTITSGNLSSLLGTYNANRPGKGQAYDTFLNYSASNFQSSSNIWRSVQAVEASGFTTEDVYQGAWIVSMARSWSNLDATDENKRMGIVLWGEHAQSRFLSYCNGTSSIDFQKNYQLLQDRFMSGGNRNVANRPATTNNADWGNQLATFHGIATHIPERSAIHHNLPFTTYFSTGNGERYNYKGKMTLGSWYNLGQQDVVPTYRWLVYAAGTETANTGVPFFTHTDSYIGGSALMLDNTDAVDIVLYRTELTVSAANPKARIALKRVEGAPDGTVSIIVKKRGSSEWIATNFAQIEGNTWQEQEAVLAGIAQGDVIEYVGLRTSGNTKGLMVGMLQLDDDSKVEPAAILASSVLAEVVEECQQSLSVKLRWNMEVTTGDRAQYGMIYNDECNVDHFEILYKNGEEGRVSEVGRTSSWSAYVGNLPMEDTTDPYVGVRAVSIDGKTYSETVWVHITRAQASTLPEALSSNGNYPAIILDNSSDGLTAALNTRYIAKFQVENSDADFTYENFIGTPYRRDILNGVDDKNADKTNYIFVEDPVVRVHQGQEVKLTLWRNVSSDDLRYCTARGYADWDCSEGFDGEETSDEVILKLGENNAKAENKAFTVPYTWTLKVPEDAKPGSSRLRFVFSDAWFPHPGAAGATNKGFAIDFAMEITGDNPGREAAADTHDEGIADQPVGFDEQGGGEDPEPPVVALSAGDVITADNVDGLQNGSVVAFMYGQLSFAGKAWLNADTTPLTTEEEEVLPEIGKTGSYVLETATEAGYFYLRDLTSGKYVSRSAVKSTVGDYCDIVMVEDKAEAAEFHIVPTVASNANVFRGEVDKTSQLEARVMESWTEATDYNVIKLGGNTGVAANWGLGGNGPWKLWRVYYLGEGQYIPDAVDNVEGVSSFTVVGDELVFENTDKAWVYTLDGRLVRFVTGGVSTISINGLQGAHMVRMQRGQLLRTRKVIL